MLSLETIVDHFSVGPLGCNCVILGDKTTGQAIVVDPGGDVDLVLAKLEQHGLKCTSIVHTHAHFDHVGHTSALQQATGATVMLHAEDLFLYERVQMQLDAFRVPFQAPVIAEIDRFLNDGDSISAGGAQAGVIFTPGHTPGSLCFTFQDNTTQILIAGDTLFSGSIGRSDLWGGNHDQLLRSIKQRILTLPDDTLVITGHGPTTTVADERQHNPFLI